MRVFIGGWRLDISVSHLTFNVRYFDANIWGAFIFFIMFCLLKQLMNLLTRGLQNEQLNSRKWRHYFLSLLSSLLDWFSFSLNEIGATISL